jgi:hypothetical protein
MGVYSVLSFLSNLFGNPYSIWHEGSFDTAEQCAYYHFQKHGAEIGAGNMLEYIRKANHFRQKLKASAYTERSTALADTLRVAGTLTWHRTKESSLLEAHDQQRGEQHGQSGESDPQYSGRVSG